MNKMKRFRISFELRLYILYESDNVIFFLNLIYKFSLSRFNLSIYNSFNFFILIINNLSFYTINKRELLSNKLK